MVLFNLSNFSCFFYYSQKEKQNKLEEFIVAGKEEGVKVPCFVCVMKCDDLS